MDARRDGVDEGHAEAWVKVRARARARVRVRVGVGLGLGLGRGLNGQRRGNGLGMGSFGGGCSSNSRKQPRQWLGGQWAGLSPGSAEPSQPELPGTPSYLLVTEEGREPRGSTDY
jgi:hypothetical protein